MDYLLDNSIMLMWIGTTLYAITFVLAWAAIVFEKSILRTLFYCNMVSGFVFQGLGLYIRGNQIGTFPLTNTLEIMQVIGWCAIFLVLIIQLAFRLRLLSFFSSGFVVILGLISLIFFKFDEIEYTSILVGNPWVELHVALAIFAYGSFALLAITSLMYLIQDYGLTHKIFSRFFSMLPPLRQVDEVSQRLLLIGIVSLTLATGIGVLSLVSNAWHITLGKFIASIGLVICYLSLYLLSNYEYISLRRSAFFSIMLFILAMLLLWPVRN